jgi:hypothetical protein
VKVITPGWIVALSAGAHADALAAPAESDTAMTLNRIGSFERIFMWLASVVVDQTPRAPAAI